MGLKLKLVALIALAFVVALGGVALAKTPKDVLVIVESHENFKSFDPAVTYEIPASTFTMSMYSRLVFVDYQDGKFVPVPDAAEKWEMADDGKTWTFHLRKGIKFSDGTPMTAADVVYSFQRVITLKKSPAWQFTDVLGLSNDSVKALDDHTVQIVTNGAPPNVVLTNVGNTPGCIVNMKVVKSHEKDGDMGSAWLTDHVAGAGPYMMKEWKRNTHVLLMANENYFGKMPPIKTVLIKDVPEAADRYLMMKKGDADIAHNLTEEQIKTFEQSGEVNVVKTPGQSNEYVGMNAGWGPFKSHKVRQAVKYAIDYDAILNKVRAGYAINNQQFLAVGYFGYKENNPYKRDVAKAKQLLKEAGYEKGFEVELVTNTRETRRNEAVLIQANLKEIGIKANVTIMQAAEMYGKFRKQGINMIVAGWGIDYPDADALAQPFANHRAKQLAWRLKWFDDKAADMVEAAAKEYDEAKREKIYHELTDYWLANGPFAMLYQPITYFAVNKAVKGVDKAYAGWSVHADLRKISK
jgi:peptide/nickel transport system substrate-binding protein